MLGFVLVFFLLFNLNNFYISWNLWRWIHNIFVIKHKRAVGWGFAGIMIVISNSFFISRFIEEEGTFFLKIGAYWLVISVYACLLLILTNIIVFLISKYTKVSKQKTVIIAGSIIMIVLTGILVKGTYNAYQPVVRNYEIRVNKKVPNMKDMRIVMASDMHFGKLSDKKHLQRMVKEINQLNPDIVLFPGDIIDDVPTEYIKQNMKEDMKKIQAPLGLHASLGNHDYYSDEFEKFINEMKESKVNLIKDNVVSIQDKFYLIGREDYSNEFRKPLSELVTGLDKSKPIIMMDHQPREFDVAKENGVDVVVSGHTHRGQLLPFNIITDAMYENDWGYLQKDNLHTIVSSGFGFWGIPIRTGSQSEIVVIDVHFSSKK